MLKHVLLAYDIANPARLQRVGKSMARYGVRVQKSVFECRLKENRKVAMINELSRLIDPSKDHVRIYSITRDAMTQATVLGIGGQGLPGEVLIG